MKMAGSLHFHIPTQQAWAWSLLLVLSGSNTQLNNRNLVKYIWMLEQENYLREKSFWVLGDTFIARPNLGNPLGPSHHREGHLISNFHIGVFWPEASKSQTFVLKSRILNFTLRHSEVKSGTLFLTSTLGDPHNWSGRGPSAEYVCMWRLCCHNFRVPTDSCSRNRKSQIVENLFQSLRLRVSGCWYTKNLNFEPLQTDTRKALCSEFSTLDPSMCPSGFSWCQTGTPVKGRVLNQSQRNRPRTIKEELLEQDYNFTPRRD